jgi:hypothetical protein
MLLTIIYLEHRITAFANVMKGTWEENGLYKIESQRSCNYMLESFFTNVSIVAENSIPCHSLGSCSRMCSTSCWNPTVQQTRHLDLKILHPSWLELQWRPCQRVCLSSSHTFFLPDTYIHVCRNAKTDEAFLLITKIAFVLLFFPNIIQLLKHSPAWIAWCMVSKPHLEFG